MAKSRADSFDEDDDDDLDAWNEEEENARKYDPDDEPDTFTCPYCKTEVFEGADVCPKCGSFVTFDDLQEEPSAKPKWIMVTVILLIAIFGGVVGALTWLVN